jgi:nucleotide-binding universal stress UspA family protein
METILIATDFSDAGQNATRFGFEMAKIMQAKVILFHCRNYFTSHKSVENNSISDNAERKSEALLMEVAEMYNKSRTVEVLIQKKQGFATEKILKAAAENKASYIIVGMKEKRNEFKKLIGSTVTSLISQTTIPVIVVPQKATVSVLKKIALGSDLNNENSIDIVRPLKRIVESFKANLFIVRAIDENGTEPLEFLMRCSKPDWFLKSVNPGYEFLQEEDSAKAMVNYVERNSIDLLTVVSDHTDVFGRIFYSSIINYLSFNMKVPLLILPHKIIKKTKTAKEAFDFCSGRCLAHHGEPQCEKYNKMKYEYEQEVNK